MTFVLFVILSPLVEMGLHLADHFVQALKVYVKAVGDVTYNELERSFRANDIGIYIIGIVSSVIAADDILSTLTGRYHRSLLRVNSSTPTPWSICKASVTASTRWATSSRRAPVLPRWPPFGLKTTRTILNASKMLVFLTSVVCPSVSVARVSLPVCLLNGYQCLHNRSSFRDGSYYKGMPRRSR